jgi:hypothetical protein
VEFLQHALPPAALVATGVAGSLAMGECASGTLVVLPHYTVSKGTPLWLQLAPKPLSMQGTATRGGDAESFVDTEQSPLPCRVFVGTEHGTAMQVSCAERMRVPLPDLAMGWNHVLRVWVVGGGG